jgi:hypothetical protein
MTLHPRFTTAIATPLDVHDCLHTEVDGFLADSETREVITFLADKVTAPALALSERLSADHNVTQDGVRR